jgi:glutamine amidotransferase/cyclase
VADIGKADKLVFPGVGSFGQAMTALRGMGYIDALKDYIQVSAPPPTRCSRA